MTTSTTTAPLARPAASTLPVAGRQLEGRAVLVTGGNRGIGLGLAQGCLLAGAKVVIWGRNEKVNTAAVHAMSELGEITAIRCDVADQTQVVEAFQATVEAVGSVHAVFANAGVSAIRAPFHLQTDEEWQKVFAVNIDGLRWTLREAIVHMIAHGEGGALVGVASMAAKYGMRMYAPYAASKGAVITLMQTLAVEYARKGIRSNALLPGWIDTDMTTGGSEEFYSMIAARTPANRFGVPADFARAAAFLADPSLAFHTADSIVIDGGYMNI